jgi:hypothetical protein
MLALRTNQVSKGLSQSIVHDCGWQYMHLSLLSFDAGTLVVAVLTQEEQHLAVAALSAAQLVEVLTKLL